MLELVFSAVCAPYAIAIVLGRGPTTALLLAAIGALLLFSWRISARVPLAALGIALAIAREHGPVVAAIAFAIAGIVATLGGFVGLEALFRRMPTRPRAVVACGFVLATLLLVLRRENAAVAEPSSVFVDIIALALVMSFEAARASRIAAVHLLSSGLLLPVLFTRAPVRRDPFAIAAACALLLTLAMVPPHAIATVILAIAAAAALYAELSSVQPVDLLSMGAIALALIRCRPPIAVLVAAVIAAVLTSRATSRAEPDPAS